MKLKAFAWLLFVNRLNTKDMLRRGHYNVGNNFQCALCNTGTDEDILHLLFKCHFSEQCWQCLGILWPSNIDIIHLISHAKQASGNPLFMENFIITAMVVKVSPKW